MRLLYILMLFFNIAAAESLFLFVSAHFEFLAVLINNLFSFLLRIVLYYDMLQGLLRFLFKH